MSLMILVGNELLSYYILKSNPPSFRCGFTLGWIQEPFPGPRMCIHLPETLWPLAITGWMENKR